MTELIIVALVAFALGFKISEIIHVISFKRILEDLGVQPEQLNRLAREIGVPESQLSRTETKKIVEVTLEKIGGVIYAYRRDNNQFLGQGTDHDTLIDHLNKTFAQGARIVIREQDGAELMK